MSAHNDGGPAFPQMDAYVNAAGEKPVYVAAGGMTLRDYFAAKAMQSLLLDYEASMREGVAAPRADWMETSATAAYHAADAMLAARGAA